MVNEATGRKSKHYYTMAELAAELGISKHTLVKLRQKRDRITQYITKVGHTPVMTLANLEKYLNGEEETK